VSFEETIVTAAFRNGSRTVLALDVEDSDPSRLLRKSMDVVRSVKDLVCAIKINRQLILTLGLPAVADSIIKLAHDLSLPVIMDAKLNDIGHTNEFMARTYFDSGFDAIIASPVSGWEHGLDKVFEIAKSTGKGVLLLTYMSNPGAELFYSLKAKQREIEKPIFEILTELAIEWRCDGLIVGATQPRIISRVRELIGPNPPIYSPGVGVQGGDAKTAIEAGATYLIIGRAIYTSHDPKSAAMGLRIRPEPMHS
jgi:orotidine-5'-phosphate decarboxylase